MEPTQGLRHTQEGRKRFTQKTGEGIASRKLSAAHAIQQDNKRQKKWSYNRKWCTEQLKESGVSD